MLKTKALLITSLALAVLNCSRHSHKPSSPSAVAGPLPKIDAKCTPELQAQRDKALKAIQAGDMAVKEAAVECEKFEAEVPKDMSACVLDDGQLVSLEPELKSCEAAKTAAAEKVEKEAQAKPVVLPAPPKAVGAVLTGEPLSNSDFIVGQSIFVKSENRVGAVGAKADITGGVAVNFTDPMQGTEESQNVPVSQLVAPYKNPVISLCDMTAPVGESTYVSGANSSVYHVLAAFPNDKIQVEPMSVSRRYIVIFKTGRDLVPGSAQILNVSDVRGLETNCRDGLCVNDHVEPHVASSDYSSFYVSRIFCDGTMVVRAYTYWGVYTELIAATKDFAKLPLTN